MSPISIARLHRVGNQEEGASFARVMSVCMDLCARVRGARPVIFGLILSAASTLVLIATNPQVRHWLVEAFATFCVLGGFLAAPLLTVLAWIGLALPEHIPLHQASTTLFLIAIIWMALALISAHLHHYSGSPAD